MPTYEYACRDCEEHVEVVQSFKDDPLTTCGLCGGALRKVFSAAGIIFKGSGYYVTDTRKEQAQTSSSSTDTGTGSSDSADTKSETKRDTKSDSAAKSA